MLKSLAFLGAAIAAVFSTHPSSVLASPASAAHQGGQASLSELIVTDAIPEVRTDPTNGNTAILVASSADPPVAEEVGIGVILGIAAVSGGAAGILLSARKSKHPINLGSEPSGGSAIRLDQASRGLRQRLLRLVHNDRDTATRLLSQARFRNPDRSINWYVEKVIYDLERDRH